MSLSSHLPLVTVAWYMTNFLRHWPLSGQSPCWFSTVKGLFWLSFFVVVDLLVVAVEISARFRQFYFLQNFKLRKHKKRKIQLFTFLNHQKTLNNLSFLGFYSCAVTSIFLSFHHICPNREKVKFRNLLRFFRFSYFSEKSKKVELFLNFPMHH